MNNIIMLGTGGALVTKCYNTCFIVETGGRLLVDAGGGNGILVQLERAGIDVASIHDMFITHSHTDHILGAVWIVRKVMILINKGLYCGTFNVYGHDKVIDTLTTICRMTMRPKDMAHIGSGIRMYTLSDGDTFNAAGIGMSCFDIHSTKEKQYGFRASLPDGQQLVCLGDEPYNPLNRQYAADADWLMHEAFCLYSEKDKYKPYEKSHSTALDAGRNAQELNARNLILYHTEDHTLLTRKHTYAAEAAIHFNGRIFVPDDMESISLVRK